MTVDPECVTIEDFEFTPQVSTGGRITLSFNIFAQSCATPPPECLTCTVYQNPDYCIASDLGGGVRLISSFYLNGQKMDAHEYCWPMTNRNQREAFDVIAPSEPGTYTGSVQLVGANSGDVAETKEFTVTVGDTGGTGSCPEGFTRDPQTGQCVSSGDPRIPGDGDDGGLIGEGDRQAIVFVAGSLVALKGLQFLDGD